MTLAALELVLEQALLYAPVVLGVALSFRLLDFPDLTVDGSFALGAATTAVLLTQGRDPVLATAMGVLAGMAAGMVTAQLNTRLRINKILAGILVMSILYTVNLRVLGRPNLSLLDTRTLLTPFEAATLPSDWAVVLFVAAVVIAVTILLLGFLYTETGMFVRATGNNEQLVRAMGISPGTTKLIGLGVANGAAALSGCLVAQRQGFADVGMGIGLIIAALAALLIGEALLRPRRARTYLMAALVGSVIYQAIVYAGLRLRIPATDLKLATGLMVIAAMAITFRHREEHA